MEMKRKIERCIEAQRRYCDDHGYPMFCPSDGGCWCCGHNIFGGRFGFTEEQSGAMLITFCPYCSRSFVD